MSASFRIGWDVGGWNCDKNAKSRDALVILDNRLALVGTPWRGNLREALNQAGTTREWLERLFGLCKARYPLGSEVTMAIDAALGFSDAFLSLAARRQTVDQIGSSQTNAYLHRKTEHFLFLHGWRPLSPIKDMIGSQATKAMHALAKFSPAIESCGIWADGRLLRVIEAYPTPCRNTKLFRRLRPRIGPMAHPDLEDALLCALLAHIFATQRDALVPPGPEIPDSEGWIWVPRECAKD